MSATKEPRTLKEKDNQVTGNVGLYWVRYHYPDGGGPPCQRLERVRR